MTYESPRPDGRDGGFERGLGNPFNSQNGAEIQGSTLAAMKEARRWIIRDAKKKPHYADGMPRGIGIKLDAPDEVGEFATVLLKRGTRSLRDISEAWASYAKEQGEPDTVKPLMVLQVPNSPDPKEISTWLDAIYAEWPDPPPCGRGEASGRSD